MKKSISTLIISFLFSIPLLAQTNTNQLLNSFIKNNLKTSEIVPSVSVAIVSAEEILYQETFGYANWEKQQAATNQSVYYIASCTKAFNGLLAHILAEEGIIDLNAPILDYKPFKDFKRKEVFQNITILDLLSHQSGIDNPYLSFRLAYTGEYTEAEVLQLIEEETQKNEAGKAFEYTNFGYYLLDYLLKAELGKSWKELLDEKLFQPLGMENSTAYASKVPAEKLARPHSGVFRGKVSVSPLQKKDALMHAAGGLMTNIEDASKFLQFYLGKGKGVYPEDLVENSYQQQVDAKHEYVRVFDGNGYASGWRIGEFEKERIVYHFGGYTGYFAHYSFIPKKNIGMAIFTNTDMGMTAANLVSKYAYNLYLGNKKELKKAEKILNKKVPKALAQERKAQLDHEQKMAERTWNLSLPEAQYEGIFTSEKYGSVEILYEEGQFVVMAGNLRTIATPFPTENTMRVELVPGSGTIIGFNLKEGKVVSLFHQRETFMKIK
ncbi:serine hydrolase domain-containing protein [Planktosalinus lacus]|uniref:Penicillin-binding protein n=1 Tax=Planktosalinus lacus TaxID=1526573 RepID=A0A8J2VD70_9FLAO|nr:serine hydrolase domain-containing protein [Planktosalinus lacus]GGE01295.1 penicillin-binding protein [Planktosalinus lacus]